jgi:hypothetical protein
LQPLVHGRFDSVVVLHSHNGLMPFRIGNPEDLCALQRLVADWHHDNVGLVLLVEIQQLEQQAA